MSSGRRVGPTNTASAAGQGVILAPGRLQLLSGARRGWESGRKALDEGRNPLGAPLLAPRVWGPGAPGHPFPLAFRGRSYSQAFKIAGLSHPLCRN